MKKSNKILLGIILVIVGAILTLNAVGITSIDIFFRGWWTLFIIVPCAVDLFNDSDKSGNITGLIFGILLLICCQGILDFELFWKLLVPVVVLLIGLKLILGSFFGAKGDQVFRQAKESKGGVRTGTATFSGTTINCNGEVFEGAQLDAVFGSVTCDLRGAIITGDCAVNASAIFGGIDIYVPAGVNVKVNSNSIFGGVSNKAMPNHPANPNTLYINATCLFGGVTVK